MKPVAGAAVGVVVRRNMEPVLDEYRLVVAPYMPVGLTSSVEGVLKSVVVILMKLLLDFYLPEKSLRPRK